MSKTGLFKVPEGWVKSEPFDPAYVIPDERDPLFIRCAVGRDKKTGLWTAWRHPDFQAHLSTHRTAIEAFAAPGIEV